MEGETAMTNNDNFWFRRPSGSGRRPISSPYSRRAVLRTTLLGGAGLAGGELLGCGRNAKSTTSQQAGAASTAAANETPLTGGSLNLVATADAPLDPQRTTAQATQTLAGAVYSRLFRFKTGLDPATTRNYELENDLAQSAESPDGVTWTFRLRPGITFHNVPPVNGHTVEAEDIKATFERAVDSKNPNRGALDMIDAAQIQAPAADTVVFKLKYTYAWFNSEMASPKYSWVFPREAQAGSYDPGKVPIGSGPFLFDHYTPAVEFVYKKNPTWFEKGRPYVDGVREAVVSNDAQRLAQFTAGNLDNIMPKQNDINAAKQQNPKALVITTVGASGGGYPLYFQLGDPSSPFQDVRLRRAVSMAIDRDTMSKTLYSGQAQAAFVVPPGMGKWALKMQDLSPATAQYFKYDVAGAKKLVDATGAGNIQFKLRYVTGFAPFGDIYKTEAEMINNMLNAAGFRTTLVPMDYANDYVGGGKGIRTGNFPSDNIIYTGISQLSSPDEFIFGYLDSKSTVNIERLNDSDLDALIQKSRAILQEADRVKAILDIQKYVADKMYIVNGFPQAEEYQIVQPWVHNFQYSGTGENLTETWSKVWLKK